MGTKNIQIGTTVKFESPDLTVTFKVQQINESESDGELYYSHHDLDVEYAEDDLEVVE